ncbi:hypothetical protein L1887_13048 [Cichorium endivia]|nr:hypothetical protein L1887_13048 [Cichorium endivia]
MAETIPLLPVKGHFYSHSRNLLQTIITILSGRNEHLVRSDDRTVRNQAYPTFRSYQLFYTFIDTIAGLQFIWNSYALLLLFIEILAHLSDSLV